VYQLNNHSFDLLLCQRGNPRVNQVSCRLCNQPLNPLRNLLEFRLVVRLLNPVVNRPLSRPCTQLDSPQNSPPGSQLCNPLPNRLQYPPDNHIRILRDNHLLGPVINQAHCLLGRQVPCPRISRPKVPLSNPVEDLLPSHPFPLLRCLQYSQRCYRLHSQLSVLRTNHHRLLLFNHLVCQRHNPLLLRRINPVVFHLISRHLVLLLNHLTSLLPFLRVSRLHFLLLTLLFNPLANHDHSSIRSTSFLPHDPANCRSD
jgi:hypothetical protein